MSLVKIWDGLGHKPFCMSGSWELASHVIKSRTLRTWWPTKRPALFVWIHQHRAEDRLHYYKNRKGLVIKRKTWMDALVLLDPSVKIWSPTFPCSWNDVRIDWRQRIEFIQIYLDPIFGHYRSESPVAAISSAEYASCIVGHFCSKCLYVEVAK